jgi:beta-RFAP synthase
MIPARSHADNANLESAPPARDSGAVERVSVTVPGRLHLGFVDLNGSLGRRFGSFGIALDAPATRISATRGKGLSAVGLDADRAKANLEKLARHFGIDGSFSLRVEAAIPSHVGLGSGTQLALAVGVAVARLAGLGAAPRDIARILDRGGRSSIGLITFEQGGVVLDGGRGPGDEPPPLIARLPFPDSWRILLIFDDAHKGLHGRAENEAFHRLPPMPEARAAQLCRLMLMAALPALAEQDLDRFGAAVAELQQAIGDHFAAVQGARFMSAPVAAALAWLQGQGVRGVGQSSWGPTGFALLASEVAAAALMREAHAKWPPASGLRFVLARGRNRGGEVEIHRAGAEA